MTPETPREDEVTEAMARAAVAAGLECDLSFSHAMRCGDLQEWTKLMRRAIAAALKVREEGKS